MKIKEYEKGLEINTTNQLLTMLIYYIKIWIWRYFRYERCYSTVEYGFGVSYATIFRIHGTNLTVKNSEAAKLLRNRSTGKCNRGGRCLLFQAQTLDLWGDRHLDKEAEGKRQR
jgi:hypothetical protein